MRRSRILALCLVTVFAATRPARNEDSVGLPQDETLTYDVTWSIFHAGQVVTTLTRSAEGSQNYFEVKATAHSQGFVSLVFRVDDEFQSVFNAKTLCSSRIVKKTSEGRRHKQTQIVFDELRRQALLDERDLSHSNDAEKHDENDIPACVQDVVSAFYYLRAQQLHVGQEIQIPINDGAKTQEIVVQVQARDRIRTPLGAGRMAFRVEPRIFGGLYKRKGRLLIWISDDQDRLPLRIRGESSVGSVTGNLKSVTRELEKAFTSNKP